VEFSIQPPFHRIASRSAMKQMSCLYCDFLFGFYSAYSGFDSNWYNKAVSSKEAKIRNSEADNSWWHSRLQASTCHSLIRDFCLRAAEARVRCLSVKLHLRDVWTDRLSVRPSVS